MMNAFQQAIGSLATFFQRYPTPESFARAYTTSFITKERAPYSLEEQKQNLRNWSSTAPWSTDTGISSPRPLFIPYNFRPNLRGPAIAIPKYNFEPQLIPQPKLGKPKYDEEFNAFIEQQQQNNPPFLGGPLRVLPRRRDQLISGMQAV